jgi:hypothetical protein
VLTSFEISAWMTFWTSETEYFRLTANAGAPELKFDQIPLFVDDRLPALGHCIGHEPARPHFVGAKVDMNRIGRLALVDEDNAPGKVKAPHADRLMKVPGYHRNRELARPGRFGPGLVAHAAEVLRDLALELIHAKIDGFPYRLRECELDAGGLFIPSGEINLAINIKGHGYEILFKIAH